MRARQILAAEQARGVLPNSAVHTRLPSHPMTRRRVTHVAPVEALPQAHPSRTRAHGRPASPDRVGFVFLLSLVWLLFDVGRPPTPAGIPLLISGILFIDWLTKREKQLGRYWIWWLVLLGTIASGVVLAPNTFSAYFMGRLMGILFLGTCLPLQGLVSSFRRLRWWINAFLLVSFYVGAWAATHGGFGPAGSAGQDENYVAALMTMAISVAYFSIFTDKRLWFRVLIGLAMCAYIAAIALAENPSRGGFLALLAVGVYCLWRSPRKVMGVSILGAVSVVLLLFAGDNFWKEIDTTTDYESGTGDIRLELWKAGLRMWKANPVLGVGAGNFRWVLGDYQTQEQFNKFGRSLAGSAVAHSSHIEMIAELGSLGALAMIMLTWSTWKALGTIQRPKRRPGAPPQHPELEQLGHYADAIRCAILAVLVNGIFLSLFYYSYLWLLIAVGSAMPYVHRRILQREAETSGADAILNPPPIVNSDIVPDHALGGGRLPPRRRA